MKLKDELSSEKTCYQMKEHQTSVKLTNALEKIDGYERSYEVRNTTVFLVSLGFFVVGIMSGLFIALIFAKIGG